MKKNLKLLLLMLGVLVVLGGAAVALVLTAPQEEESSESSSSEAEEEAVLEVDPADVASITVESAEGNFTMVPLPPEESEEDSSSSEEDSGASSDEDEDKEDLIEFTLEGYEDYNVVTTRVDTSAYAILGLSATKNLGAQEDLSAFGLEGDVLATFTIHYTSGEEDVILLGDEAAESSGNYVLVNDTVYISTIPSQTYNGPLSYLDTKVYTVADRTGEDGASEEDELTSLDLSGAHFPQAIHIETDPDRISGYRITAPVTAESGTSTLETIITALKTISASDVVDQGLDQETLAQYGLDAPDAVAAYTLNGESHTLTVSAANEYGYRYLIADDQDLIYMVNAESVESWAETDLMDLRLSTIWLPNIQDVETLTLTAEGDMVYSFDVTKVLNEERSTETVPAYDLEIVNAGGEDIDYDLYQDFYQELIGTPVLSVDPAEYEEQAALTVEYSYYDNGGTDTVSFHQVPGKDRYAALLNGEFNGLVRKDDVESLLEALPQLNENQGGETEESSASSQTEESSQESESSQS